MQTKVTMRNNRKPVLSLIIAAYNVQDEIAATLQSVLTQRRQELEIIIIDDASTDATWAHCRRFAAHENVILHRHTFNRGLSEVRNTGMRMATGEWLAFLDGDDQLTPGAINQMVQTLDSTTDLVVFGFQKIRQGNVIQVFKPTNNLQHIYTGAWNKIYRRQLVRDLLFPPGRFFEDMAFTAIAFLRASHVKVLEAPLVKYCVRDSSITQSSTVAKHVDVVAVLQQLVDYRTDVAQPQDVPAINMLLNKQLFSHMFQVLRYRQVSLEEKVGVLRRLFQAKRRWQTGWQFDDDWRRQCKDVLIWLAGCALVLCWPAKGGE